MNLTKTQQRVAAVVGLVVLWIVCTAGVYIGAHTFGGPGAADVSVVVSSVVALGCMGIGGALWMGETWWERRSGK